MGKAALWLLVAAFAIVSLQRSLLPSALPDLLTVALSVLLPFAFALVHGAMTYGFRAMFAFLIICLVVSNVMENVSILTGFPFGHYFYTDALGPKLLQVPQLIGPAYMATGYASWMLARLILARPNGTAGSGSGVVTVPVIASFIMVSWDLSIDPVASTLTHKWIWLDGGPYFGVPFSNFMGWFLTVYVFLALFAFFVRNHKVNGSYAPPQPADYWLQVICIYAITALPAILNIVSQPLRGSVPDHTGTLWRVGDIYVSTGLVCIFTMGAFVALALGTLARGRPFQQTTIKPKDPR